MNGWIVGGVVSLALGVAGARQAPRAESPRIFCEIGALTPAERERQAELRRVVEEAVIGAREQPDGYALRLDPSDAVFVAAAEWIVLEARCCAFLRFSLERGDETWLALGGGDGVKAFLAGELGALLR